MHHPPKIPSTPYEQWQQDKYGNYLPETGQGEDENGTQQAAIDAEKISQHFEIEQMNPD